VSKPLTTPELRPGDRILVTDDPDGLLPASEFTTGPWFPALPGNLAPVVATVKKITIEPYGYRRTIMWDIETDRGDLEGYEEAVEFHKAPEAGDDQ
jgi:hypothetical protein